MSDQGFTQFLVDCVVRPRQAARTAHGIDKTWSVVILASAVVALTVGIGLWIRMRSETDPDVFSFTGPGHAPLEAAIEAVITFLISVVSFPLGVFIWNKLFGFHPQSRSVIAAVTAGFGLALVTAPLFEVLTTALWAAGVAAYDWLPMTANIALSLGLSTVYFSEALAISFASALARNIISGILLLVILGLPIAAIAAIPILAEGVSDGAAQ